MPYAFCRLPHALQESKERRENYKSKTAKARQTLFSGDKVRSLKDP
jgi:hypothetical protein